MSRSTLLLMSAILTWTLAMPLGLSQDSDFSLDGNSGGNSGAESQALDETQSSEAELFGGESLLDAPSDSKSTIVKPGSNENSPISPQQKTQSLPAGSAIDNPASQLTPAPAAMSQAPAQGANYAPLPAPMSMPASPRKIQGAPTQNAAIKLDAAASTVSETAGITPPVSASDNAFSPAPLAGDGSLAPVKSNSSRAANEFGGVPPLPGTRRAMAAGEAPEFYDVEEGDTMFDVCNQLIDDGNYWPKLWSLNPDVKNPHFIFPGMKLAFYSGDQENPPFLEVVADDEMVPVEKGEIKEAELVSEPVQSIGNEGGSVKVLRGIEEPSPISVVGPSDISSDGDALDGFIFSGRTWNSDDVSISVPAFYFAEEKESLGRVIGGIYGEGIAGDNRKILVSPTENLALGTYTVLRPAGLVTSLRTGEDVGYRYEFEGNVRLTRKTQGGLMEGLVFDGFGGIRAGDIVVNFLATKRTINNVSSVGTPGTASSSVIGFQDAGKRTGGTGDVVFLEKNGVSVGSYYAIFNTEGNRTLRHQPDLDAQKDVGAIAVARVIEVSGEAAIGYIVYSTAEVRVGDSLTSQ